MFVMLSSWLQALRDFTRFINFDEYRLSSRRPLTLRPSHLTWAVSLPAKAIAYHRHLFLLLSPKDVDLYSAFAYRTLLTHQRSANAKQIGVFSDAVGNVLAKENFRIVPFEYELVQSHGISFVFLESI